MKILILGAGGMLGNATFRFLAEDADYDVMGTCRDNGARRHFSNDLATRILPGVDVEEIESLGRAFAVARPQVVINCIGLIKQLAEAEDPLRAVPINTLLPHQLAALCRTNGARLVHISTDCVFSGSKGSYVETDFPDAGDLYGRSKLLGEVDYPHAITLRTSMIGHELDSNRGLLGWFLAQAGPVKGFCKAKFSGLPTVELARVIRDFVLPHPELHGLYHVAAEPIDKNSLLKLVSEVYRKTIEIVPDDRLVIDRSLNAKRFEEATGYRPAPWPELIKRMYEFR
jgi:dTDP-4-dehydrorhamnose reductase